MYVLKKVKLVHGWQIRSKKRRENAVFCFAKNFRQNANKFL